MSTHHIILADRVANVSAGLREGADAGFHMTPSTRRQWANKLDHIAAELRARQPADAEGRDVADAIRAARTEGDLADAWIGSRPKRLGMGMPARLAAIEAWIDALSRMGNDGR